MRREEAKSATPEAMKNDVANKGGKNDIPVPGFGSPGGSLPSLRAADPAMNGGALGSHSEKISNTRVAIPPGADGGIFSGKVVGSREKAPPPNNLSSAGGPFLSAPDRGNKGLHFLSDNLEIGPGGHAAAGGGFGPQSGGYGVNPPTPMGFL